MRRSLGLTLLLGLALGSACSDDESAFPPNGTLTAQVLDRTLAGQTAEEATNQFVKWTISKLEADVTGVGTVNFLRADLPCEISLGFAGFDNRCATNGLVLDPASTGPATLRLEIAALEVVRGSRPELTALGDFDGDGHLDLEDNCPYVDNEDQANENESEEGENPVGDACTNANGAKDSDADTVADSFDNCVYVANPLQENDRVADGVGNACEQKVLVSIPATGLLIRRTDQAFTIQDERVTAFVFDFRTKDWCGHGSTACTLDPADVILTVQ